MAALLHVWVLLCCDPRLYAYSPHVHTVPRMQPAGIERQRTSSQMSHLSVPTLHTDMQCVPWSPHSGLHPCQCHQLGLQAPFAMLLGLGQSVLGNWTLSSRPPCYLSFFNPGLRSPSESLVETTGCYRLWLGALMPSRPLERKQVAMLGIQDTNVPWSLDLLNKNDMVVLCHPA